MTTKCDRNIDPLGCASGNETEVFYDNAKMEYVVCEREPREATAVGDLNSDAPGSGARKNEGKAQMDLIPVAIWRRSWSGLFESGKDKPEVVRLRYILRALEGWQRGETGALNDYFTFEVTDTDMDAATAVFEFGAQKYKAWNWAKGMAWSVPTGCILRHATAILHGELVDPESGQDHLGHIICNLIMLQYYAIHYPEGDDRPPRRAVPPRAEA